jgi:hypothetical protein
MTKHGALFLSAALAVRLTGLNAAAIWFDEAISKYRASLPLATYFGDLSDFIGPNLWELILRPFAVGPVWLLRLPALIASIVALWFAWRIMDRLAFTNAQRITAAVPMILLPGLIWQAQDARYYAGLSLIYMAALWFGITRSQIGLLACMALLPYLHPVGLTYAAGALAVAWINGLQFRQATAIGFIALISWIPSLAKMPLQSWNGQGFWLTQMTAGYALTQTAQAFIVNTTGAPAALVLLALLLLVLAVGAFRIQDHAVRIAWTAIIVPVIALLAATIIRPVYFYRTAQPVAIPVCLLAGLILAPARSMVSKIAPAIGALILIITLANWNPASRGGYIDRGAQVISRNWHEGDQIMYTTLTVAVPFLIYLPNRESCLVPNNGLDELPPSLLILDECSSTAAAGNWIIWPRDSYMNPELTRQLSDLTDGMIPVWRSDAAWQFAPMEIYYLP